MTTVDLLRTIQAEFMLAGLDPLVYPTLVCKIVEDSTDYAKDFHFDLMRRLS